MSCHVKSLHTPGQNNTSAEMGSFFKNLMKSANSNAESEPKKTSSKWLFMFKKTNDQSEQSPFIIGQEDNHGRIKSSNAISSSKSSNLSDGSLKGNEMILLPKLRKHIFHIPRYVPSNDWIRSQLFEVAHLLSSFVDLISAKHSVSAKQFDSQLDEILQLIDEQSIDLKSIFIGLFDLISSIYKDEIAFWTELKFEAHLNSLLAQLIELCSQLPVTEFSEVLETIKAQGHAVDVSAFKNALMKLESLSISRNCSDANGDS